MYRGSDSSGNAVFYPPASEMIDPLPHGTSIHSEEETMKMRRVKHGLLNQDVDKSEGYRSVGCFFVPTPPDLTARL